MEIAIIIVLIVFVLFFLGVLCVFYGLHLKIVKLKQQIEYEKYLNEDLLKQFFKTKL